MSAEEPAIDFTKINFPMDRLSIKLLRERFPDVFDQNDENEGVHFSGSLRGEDLEAVLEIERDIARWAFEVALGKASPDEPPIWEGDARENLADSLVEYGLAAGPHEAKQLVRDLQAQAAAQAQNFRPPSLPPRP